MIAVMPGVMVRVRAGHRVIAMTTQRMTAGNASDGQPTAPERAVPLQCLERVDRAGRLIAAAIADPRAEQQAIGAHRQGDQPGGRRAR